MANYTFKQFRNEYPDDDACLNKILAMRFGGNEFVCPDCETLSKFHRITGRRGFACQKCGHHVFPCVGTIFEKSRTPLTDWFFAMYLMTSTRHGVAAKEIQRQLGVTYKTAWRMCHELRKHMANSDDHRPMSGHVEIDEAFIGGKQHDPKRRKPSNKTILFGMVERDGIVRSGPVQSHNSAMVQTNVFRNVVRGSTISSDEWPAYKFLADEGYTLGSVNHSKKQWKKGIHHTNTIEGYWAQVQRSIRGTHIHVSRQHLWKYVSEFNFRYNMRKAPEQMFNRLVSCLAKPRLATG